MSLCRIGPNPSSGRSAATFSLWEKGFRAAVFSAMVSTAAAAQSASAPEVVGDAMPVPLAEIPGNPARGRALVMDRRKSSCLLCHSGPFPEERFQGDLAPDISGAGARWSVPQLRLRIANSRALNAETIMPSYARAEGFHRVAAPLAGKPILTGQEIEDIVAFLATLK